MQAPNRTTELMSAVQNEGEPPRWNIPPAPASKVATSAATPLALPIQDGTSAIVKDTDSRGGGDGQNGARGDGLLSIPQVTRAVGTSHDPCEQKSS